MARETVPFPFEAAQYLQTVGENLRTARLRRNMTIEEVASRVGVHRETLALAEKGSPNVSIGTYVGALWVYGLLKDLTAIADPDLDAVGRSLDARNGRERARTSPGMTNDF